MRDFCVAVSALVPLLVLALTVETRVPARLARRQWEPFVSAIMKNPFVGGDEQQVFDRLLTLFGITLGSAVAVELSVLLSIPFVPEGRPANGWQVFLLLFAGVVVLWIFVLVAWALVGLVREVSHEELDAAVASASEPSTRRRDDPE